jgi:hypothetical protein
MTMNLRQIIDNLKQSFPDIALAVLAIGGAAVAIWFLPQRTAAVILGILAAVALSIFVVRGLQRTTQIALLWLSLGVVADAAYAKLNDQTPVTVANLLVRLGESMVKLIEVVIRSFGIGGADLRAKMTAVAPEFIWALLLTTTLLLIISLAGRQRSNAGAKPELRRAA